MPTDSSKRRRWAGGLALAAAVLMLVLGETLLRDRLSRTVFVVYWLVCFLLVAAAMLAAILDVRALQRRTRLETEAMLQQALEDISTKARRRRQSQLASKPDQPETRGKGRPG